jgi:hypothetical protein
MLKEGEKLKQFKLAMSFLLPRMVKALCGKMKKPGGKLLMIVGTYTSKEFTSPKTEVDPSLASGCTNLRIPAVPR